MFETGFFYLKELYGSLDTKVLTNGIMFTFRKGNF